MARDLEEINASSMADIAFLLLVFFLVTSTFNKDLVLEEKLPQKMDVNQPAVKVKPWNVLQITANKNDDVSLQTIDDHFEYVPKGDYSLITEWVEEFYKHPSSDDNHIWPATTKLTTKMAMDSSNKYKLLSASAEVEFYQKMYDNKAKIWKKRSDAAEMFGGAFTLLSDKAVMAIKLDNSTKFKTYIEILDAIYAGINPYRDELCMEYFDRPYSSLNPKIEEEEKIIKALDIVYPKRIMKTKGIAGKE